MISLQAYREAIGTFTQRLIHRYGVISANNDFDSSLPSWLLSILLDRNQLTNVILTFFGVLIAINMSFLKLELLIKDGDVESNPGPATYTILKSVTGSYHQANIKFGETAGRQCVCNAIYAIAWSTVRIVSSWTANDLDYILSEGDKLYKGLNTTEYLSVEDIPSSIVVNGASYVISKLNVKQGNLCRFNNNSTTFADSYKNEVNKGSGMLLIFDGIAISIIWNKAHFFLFDAHSRDSAGNVIENGTSILLKFRSLIAAEKYIKNVHLKNKDLMLYDLQYILIDLDSINCEQRFDIDFVSMPSIDRKRAQKRKYHVQNYDTFKNSDKYQDKLRHQKDNYDSFKNTDKYQDKLRQQKTYKAKNYDVFKKTDKYQDKLRQQKTYRAKNYDTFKNSDKYQDKLCQQKQAYVLFKTSDKYWEKLCQQKADYDALKYSDKYDKRLSKNKNYKETVRKNVYKKTPEQKIERFKTGVQNGPFHICVICNRCLYRRSVLLYNFEKYKLPENDFFYVAQVTSFDKKEYICITCDKKLKKNEVPCQAVCNRLKVCDFPPYIPKLRRLEKVIIAKRLLFKKIAIMPKGQSPKLKGAICNVPVETESVCDTLPRGADSNGIIMVKLKRKLMYQGHVFFEAVRPDVVINVLQYLKLTNHLYEDVSIDESQIPENLLNLNDDEELPVILEKEDQLEDTENPLDENRLGGNETALISTIPTQFENETFTIAPCEGKKPMSILSDKYCEELAHPYLLPTGKFGYNVEREVRLTPNKYFNQRLLNYKQTFASESDYIFFAHAVYQQLNMTSRINIAMQKVCSNQLTAGMLSQNFKETVKSFVANDEAYSFMSSIKGTPAYWKKFLFEVLAMVKQLGLPTFFMTLSCADLRWSDLPSIISKLNGLEKSDDELKEMNYEERCKLLNSNSVLMARHFQYRVELFFKEIIVDGPLGKVKSYAIRVEFQVRGSPHIHSFLWILGAPELSRLTKQEYITFIDQIIKANMPNPENEMDLFKLVQTYQVHSHSRSCRKYKNVECRYNFGKFFTDHTIISEPLPDELPDSDKQVILEERYRVLSKVKDYIDTNLNPRTVNIIDPSQDSYVKPSSILEVLYELNITEDQYYKALSVSIDSDFELHLKRSTNSCFVNNYFVDGLQAWEANIDIQPVFNHYKAVSYMCAYFSKAEDESSEAMKQVAKEAMKSNLSTYEQMKAIARAYITKRECSVQEAVYHVMPELWLRKSYPHVIFINTNLPEKRFRICRSEDELSELPEESTDVFKRNMLDRYMERPNRTLKNGKYSVADTMCFAEFSAYYYLPALKCPSTENDSQPEVLEDQDVEENHAPCAYPSVLPIMSDKNEKLKCRKVRAVLRYHVPNQNRRPEEYAHHILFMYFPFRNEAELCETKSGTYIEKLIDPHVMAVVNENKIKIEPYGDLVDTALSNLRSHITHNQDSYAQQENDEVENLVQATDILLPEDPADDPILFHEGENTPCTSTVNIAILSDDEINGMICSLNLNQRKIFDVIIKWVRNHVKQLSCAKRKNVDPLHLFITGGGGCGKSHLAKTIFQSLTKTLSYHAGDPGKAKVLMLAPTGVAAVNVSGATIHSALGIPVGNYHKTIPKLNDKTRSKLRTMLSSVKVILIDEVSMVSNMLLLHIHQRLTEIFGTSEELPFAGLSVMAFGDLYQLPPINQRPIYSEYKDALLNISPLWRMFRMAELTEVVRQKGDTVFIDLLNKVRVGNVDEDVESLLQSRFVSKTSKSCPVNAMHIWAENLPVSSHNREMLNRINEELHIVNAIDILPKNVKSNLIDKALSRSQCQTGGLAAQLSLKVNARVMITSNIDVASKLSNGQIGTVIFIKLDGRKVSCIYVKLDDETAGVKLMNSDNLAKRLKAIPITRVETNINIHANKSSSPVIKRTQFPLMLAWACTVHKVQGKQFKEGVISFELFKQRRFNYGQMYVGLSRVESLTGLSLIGEYNPKAIQSDPRATAEYELLRSEYLMAPIDDCTLSQSSLSICLLNTRSLHKHAIDINSDKVIMHSDIICLTETQIEEQSITLNEILGPDFKVIHNVSSDKFCSIATCLRTNNDAVELLNVFNLPGATLVTVKKEMVTLPVHILLLYKKQSLSIENFFYIIRHMSQNVNNKVHIILGDFNINAYNNESAPLQELLGHYTMIVEEPTHLSGTLLDHVYIRSDFLETIPSIWCIVKCIFFSDHDAVKFQLELK